jgi:hypothetical protein
MKTLLVVLSLIAYAITEDPRANPMNYALPL